MISFYNSPIGLLKLTFKPDQLERIDFVKDETEVKIVEKIGMAKETESAWVIQLLDDYFAGHEPDSTLLLNPLGTPFQQQVWRAMAEIPWGKVLSYKEVAEKIGRPKAYRAVANACGANSIPVLIPCHRVTASHGLGGYGSGIHIKEWLLKHEGYLT